MIDQIIFKSEKYFNLLQKLSPSISVNFEIEDYTTSYFETYKTMEPNNDDWDIYDFRGAQFFFNTEFIYEVDNSQYVGVYTDLDGRQFIVKLYHGGEFEIIGDTLSNWVETQYMGILKFEPERIKNFQNDCYITFGIDSNKKFDASEPFKIRVTPDNNKLFIGQEKND